MRIPAFIASLCLTSSLAGAQDRGPPPDLEASHLVHTIDQRAAGRCLGDLAGFSNVRMQCIVDARGAPSQCELINPTPVVRRYERVFRCMASKMKVTYLDGSPATGQPFEVSLGGRGVLSDDEYQRLRNEERRNP